MHRALALLCCLTLLAVPAAGQNVQQTLRQLHSGSDEARMAAFYKLLGAESGTANGGLALLRHKDAIVRELLALGEREKASLLDVGKHFSPEQMQYYTQLFQVVGALRNPGSLDQIAASASAATAGDFADVLRGAARAGVSNKETEIVMSGLLRLLSDTSLQGLLDEAAPATKRKRPR